MSTENLNKNQKFVHDIIRFYENNGGSAGYLASLEAAKTSNVADRPEIPANQQPDGTMKFQIYAVVDHYAVDITCTKPLHLPPVIGEGYGSAELDGHWSFAPDYFFLNGATLKTLLDYKTTTLTWFRTGDQTVGIVTGPDGKNVLHTMPVDFKIKSGSSVTIVWSVEQVP